MLRLILALYFHEKLSKLVCRFDIVDVDVKIFPSSCSLTELALGSDYDYRLAQNSLFGILTVTPDRGVLCFSHLYLASLEVVVSYCL